MMIAADPINLNKLAETIISNLPSVIAALIAAAISWHNRAVAKETQREVRETKTMVNGRMDALIQAATDKGIHTGRQQIKDAINIARNNPIDPTNDTELLVEKEAKARGWKHTDNNESGSLR